MKLATFTTALKNNLVRGAGAVALAAAAAAVTPAANAQRLSFGVSVGGPAYYAPAPVVVYGGPSYGYGYWDGYHVWHRDYDRDRFYAHRDWDRDRYYHRDFDDRRFDDRRFDRDHDRHDGWRR